MNHLQTSVNKPMDRMSWEEWHEFGPTAKEDAYEGDGPSRAGAGKKSRALPGLGKEDVED